MNKGIHRLALVGEFVRAAVCYWLVVAPRVWREVGQWRARARSIADPALRGLALETLSRKWGNVEGAAAFAAFVPRAARPLVLQALLSIQAAYDYADTVSEQPGSNRVASGRQMHLALPCALQPPETPHPDYYTQHPQCADSGYLSALVDACRGAFSELPAHAIVAPAARRASSRIVTYQSLNHSGPLAHERLAAWAGEETPAASGLGWWETAAAAASSLALLALIAAAADPSLQAREVRALEQAYFPWIGALHTLLDSLIDYQDDLAAGQPSLISPYGSPTATAAGLQRLTTHSLHHARSLDRRRPHLLLLAAMTSLYLTAPQAYLPYARRAAGAVLRSIGGLAAPAMLILALRRAVLGSGVRSSICALRIARRRLFAGARRWQDPPTDAQELTNHLLRPPA